MSDNQEQPDETSANRPGDSSPDESVLPSESELMAGIHEDFSEPEHRWPPELKKGYQPLSDNPWVLTEFKGEGGFGQTWRATDTVARDKIFKFARMDMKEGIDTLKLEIEKASKLAQRHRGFVHVEPHLAASIPCVSMDFIEGKDLRDVMEERADVGGPLPPPTAASVIFHIAEIIAIAHQEERPIVHRDLKPDNIMVPAHNPPDPLPSPFIVIDFGIAAYHRSEGDSNTDPGDQLSRGIRQNVRFHTPRYAAPEQKEGDDPHPRQDVFALGMIWFELLTLPLVLDRPKPNDYKKLLSQGMTESQVKLLKMCNDRNPEDRIQNAKELADGIRSEYPELNEDHAAPLTISTENELTVEWSDLAADVTTTGSPQDNEGEPIIASCFLSPEETPAKEDPLKPSIARDPEEHLREEVWKSLKFLWDDLATGDNPGNIYDGFPYFFKHQGGRRAHALTQHYESNIKRELLEAGQRAGLTKDDARKVIANEVWDYKQSVWRFKEKAKADVINKATLPSLWWGNHGRYHETIQSMQIPGWDPILGMITAGGIVFDSEKHGVAFCTMGIYVKNKKKHSKPFEILYKDLPDIRFTPRGETRLDGTRSEIQVICENTTKRDDVLRALSGLQQLLRTQQETAQFPFYFDSPRLRESKDATV